MGRPNKFKEKYCQLLIEHAKQGRSFQSFADKIDVSIDTIHEWAKPENSSKYPNFSEAKKKARNAALAFWESHYITATIRVKDEEPTYAYDRVLLIFAMKNMAGWTDKQEISGVGEDNVIKLAYSVT